MSASGPKLVLVRHAEAQGGGEGPDQSRPLTRRGRTQAAATGRWLKRQGISADVVWCSSASRTRQTWELLAEDVPARDVVVERALYDAAPGDVVARSNEWTAGTMLVVGHNPTMEGALVALTGTRRGMRPSAAAVIDLAESSLESFWDPRD